MQARGQAANSRYGSKRLGNKGYGARTRRVQRYRYFRFKKTKEFPEQVNKGYLEQLNPRESVDIDIYNVLASEPKEISAEMDEMWSYYRNKSNQIWLWWAVDHATNTPLAYTFGTREHRYLDELLELLKPFNIGKVYSDENWAYRDRISIGKLVTGKRNTQQIERHHLTLRTRVKRLCRKTICFSKNRDIHIAVVGMFINTYFFGRTLDISTYL
jgi:insertion element IS1 protein InsB